MADARWARVRRETDPTAWLVRQAFSLQVPLSRSRRNHRRQAARSHSRSLSSLEVHPSLVKDHSNSTRSSTRISSRWS